MKKVTVVFLKLFLFVSLVFAGDGAYVFDPGTYYMMDTNVNIRSEPNTHSQNLGKLQPGLDKFEKIHYLDAIPLGDKNHLSEGIQYRLTLEPENCFKITVLLDTEPFRIYNCTLNGTDNLTVKFFDRDKFISNYKSFSVVNEYLKEEYLSVNNEEYKVYSKDGVKLEGWVFKNDFFLTEISCTNPSIDFGEGIKVGCSKKVIEDLLCSPDDKGYNCYIYRTEAETLIIYFDKETEVVSKIVFSANI